MVTHNLLPLHDLFMNDRNTIYKYNIIYTWKRTITKLTQSNINKSEYDIKSHLLVS